MLVMEPLVFCSRLRLRKCRGPTKAITRKLWDGHRVIANAVVTVDNDKIKASCPMGRYQRERNHRSSRYTGIPGMIDSYVHMAYYWDGAPGTTPRRQRRSTSR
jgi:hypothetical protein